MRHLRRTFALLGCAALMGCVGASGPTPAVLLTPYPATTASIAPPPGTPYGGTCYAGFYVCRLPSSLPVASRCTCPGIGAPSFGVVR